MSKSAMLVVVTGQIESIKSEVKSIESSIIGSKTDPASVLSIKRIGELADRLAYLYGFLEKLQGTLDTLKLDDDAEKEAKRTLTQQAEELDDRIIILSEAVDEYKSTLAEQKKELGNEQFKKGNYAAALALYDEAIAFDSSKAVFYTNRALTKQKLDDWDGALEDSEVAVSLDVDMLKAYIIKIKCELKLEDYQEAALTIDTVPRAHQERPELLELKKQLASTAKDEGNSCLKDGDVDGAIEYYSLAVRMDPSCHIYFSNRSAAYQQKRMWREAAADADEAIKINPTFAKGYLHLARSYVQLKRFSEAISTVSKAKIALDAAGELAPVEKQLDEILAQVEAASGRAGTSSRQMPSRPTAPTMTPQERAEAFKKKGNDFYKEGEYQDAIRLYSQAIAALPSEGAYYGNRAACWIMLKEYKRAADDCTEGLKYEKRVGELDKLRQRQANALVQMGKVDAAIAMVEEIVNAPTATTAVEVKVSATATASEGTDVSTGSVRTDKDIAAFREQLQTFNSIKSNISLASESLEKGEFSRAKRLLTVAQTNGASEDPVVRLMIAKAHLGLGELEDASREAQKVISSTSGGAGFMLSRDAYVVRADALAGLGITEQAIKYLSAAIQLDPDNTEIGRKLKNLKRLVADTARVRSAYDDAMSSRKYDVALSQCAEGLQLDRTNKKLMAEMHLRRGRVYQAQAKAFLKNSAPSSISADAEEAAQRARDQMTACWRRCLQDASSVLYYEGNNSGGSEIVAATVLKAAALQGLEQWEEAVSVLEEYQKALRKRGEEDDTIGEKLQEAKLLLKKSKRKDLYALIGVAKGAAATEQEIKTAYRKAALKWHPDRHSASSEEKKKEAETKFKEINDAFELLTDPVKRRLYDQGYDREEIDQRADHEKNMGAHRSHGYGRRGYGGHYGDYEDFY